MRVEIPDIFRDPEGGEESRKQAEAKIEARMKDHGVHRRGRVRKGFELKAGDYHRGRALDQRVRARLLGF
jgi:hypothetical protein